MLAAMFSGRHPVNKDKHGRYFIDADGAIFAHILNYLRFGRLPPESVTLQVHEYAEYFGLQTLASKTSLLSVVREDQQLVKARALYQNYIVTLKCVLGKITSTKYGPVTLVFGIVGYPASEKSEKCGNNHKKVTESDFVENAVSDDPDGWNLIQALLCDLAKAGVIVNDTTCNKCIFCEYPYQICGCTKYYKIHVSRRFNINLLN